MGLQLKANEQVIIEDTGFKPTVAVEPLPLPRC